MVMQLLNNSDNPSLQTAEVEIIIKNQTCCKGLFLDCNWIATEGLKQLNDFSTHKSCVSNSLVLTIIQAMTLAYVFKS